MFFKKKIIMTRTLPDWSCDENGYKERLDDLFKEKKSEGFWDSFANAFAASPEDEESSHEDHVLSEEEANEALIMVAVILLAGVIAVASVLFHGQRQGDLENKQNKSEIEEVATVIIKTPL